MIWKIFDPNYRTYSLNGNRTQITNNAIAFCEVVKNAGYTPMVYYGSGNLNNFDTNLLSSRYKIWFARYPSYWDENTKLNYNGHYDIWQYTSEGSVPGIAGNVDKNVMYVDTVTYRYYLTYHANGGVNAPVHSTAYDKGASVSVAGPGSMSREGYTFTGWNTKPDGSGTKYAAGSTYTNITGSVILYAQWQKLEQVGILYDANGGQNAPVDAKHYYAGGSVPVLDARQYEPGGLCFYRMEHKAGWQRILLCAGQQYSRYENFPYALCSMEEDGFFRRAARMRPHKQPVEQQRAELL